MMAFSSQEEMIDNEFPIPQGNDETPVENMTDNELLFAIGANGKQIDFLCELAMFAPGDSQFALTTERESVRAIADRLGISTNRDYYHNPHLRELLRRLRAGVTINIDQYLRNIDEFIYLKSKIALLEALADDKMPAATKLRHIQLALNTDPRGRGATRTHNEGSYRTPDLKGFDAAIGNGMKLLAAERTRVAFVPSHETEAHQENAENDLP